MPKFETLNPDDIAIGRGRAAAEARKLYIAAIGQGDAGRITLDRVEKSSTVKRLLSEASKQCGIRVRSSWADKTQRVLLWKRVGV
ncbi:MAG: hypothetical protein HOH95_00100 [Dehalococcoidia bacterium]|jgi:hypothetical protein|nr:hypothetical protein [Dehalococcoidia bacterium]